MYTAKYSAPSNIALIKYWGKKTSQIPMNASLSMTLKNCKTETEIQYFPNKPFEINFYLDGKKEVSFVNKIESLLKKMSEKFDWILKGKFDIYSHNTFPHSSGIASSASGMAAFVLCIFDIHFQLKNDFFDFHDHLNDISSYSRVGSGSACRSLFPGFAIWGDLGGKFNSSDNYAVNYSGVSDFYKTLCDTILIVSKNKKSVSSSDGHQLMNHHPYKEIRIKEANRKLFLLLEILNQTDFDQLADLIEQEALELHALMMTSSPSFILLEPSSIKLIQMIRHQRSQGHKITFTIDAGPNIHLIYPESESQFVMKFCEEVQKNNLIENFINDEIGIGPVKL